MNADETSPTASASVKRWSRRKRAAALAAGLIVAWFLVSYVVLPLLWKRYEHRHPWHTDGRLFIGIVKTVP